MNKGCTLIRTNAGHEIWGQKGLSRPIVFQTHINPVPEFIIKNSLRALGISKNDFWKTLEQ